MNKLLSRRLFILSSAKLAVFCGLAGRLYYLQIINGKGYKILADENRIKKFAIPPLRGKILDCNSVPLAVNSANYSIVINPHAFDHVASTLNFSPKVKEKLHKQIRKRQHVIYNNVNWQELKAIAINNVDGVRIIQREARYYPFSSKCSHLVGYIRAGSNKAGVESLYDRELQGVPGVAQGEVNAKGKIVKMLSTQDSVPGRDVQLSINIRLQDFINRISQGMRSAATVMDVRNGDILAMCSNPSYDNNAFIHGFSTSEWHEMQNDKSTPMLNRPITLTMSPGSTFKMIVGLTALEDGIVDEDTEFVCPGYLVVGNRKFHCWKHGGHGIIALRDAIAESCNVYFYNIGLKINIDRLVSMAERFGLGGLHLNLPEEARGLLPTQSWRADNGRWWIGDTLNNTIGHGYILSTPIQLLVMAARIATGRMVEPSIIKGASANFADLDINPNYLNFIRQGMYGTVSYGTASRIATPRYNIAGKTGTVQIASHGHNTSTQDHALFVGYAPYESPRYAVSVVIEHGRSGYNAAVVARKIFDKVWEMYGSDII